MKKFLIVILCLLGSQMESAFCQKKLLERLASNANDSTQKARFIILPALGYAQETGFEYGLVSLTSFFTSKDTITRNSTIGALVSFTTKKQSMITIKPDIWSKENRYHYIGDLRYKNFPFSFYGIGNDTRKEDEEKITQKLSRISGEVEKLIKKGFYIGINANYEYHTYTDKEPGGIFENDSFIRDKDGGEVLFLGISQITDSRNSNVYTTKGTYLKLNYSYAPDIFGGENFTGSSAKIDFRTFKSYSPQTVLGFNLIYQTIQQRTTPFYLLPQMGNDQMMRGYYTGRYRDRNLLAAQVELKYKIIPKVGVVVFAGAGSVFNTNVNISHFKPSYGGGLRYFFDAKRGLSLRMDYAFGEKRSDEKRQKGFYLALGEAF